MNIALITKNKFKSEEIKNIMHGYGFRLFIFDSIEDLSFNENEEYIVLREFTHLEKNGKLFNDFQHLDVVNHVSFLNVIHVKGNLQTEKSYKGVVEGFIDLNRKQNRTENIYNWDDVFVCIKNLKSYYEMKDSSGKFSARTLVISDFLNDNTFFDEKVDLNFNPFNQDNVVEFNNKIYNLIENNQYISKYKTHSLLNGIMTNILSNGIFTRSSMNKKQRNYWYPALNAGLPLVPKKDEIHEVTFMFHDLMHHAIPDLILTGNHSDNHKKTYVIHRMISEAFTLVLADMLFVDHLNKNNVEYDWTKRKIHPLYESMNIENITKDKLKEIVKANVSFALLGDYQPMISLTNESVFDSFKNKYEKFFIEDYRWTYHNYDNMIKNKSDLQLWFEANKYLIKQTNTLDYYENLTFNENNYENKVFIVFEEIWKRIERYIDNPVDYNQQESILNAFKNYIIGQSILFFKYDYLEESKTFFNLIHKELSNNIEYNDIDKVRQFFNFYIDKLISENKINLNTGLVYKEIVPLFDAFYVFYDKKLQFDSVKDFLNKIK